MSSEQRLGRSPSRNGTDREPATHNDLVGRMAAAAPAARRCWDPVEELHLPVPDRQVGSGISRMVPGQRCG
jgi:hypothetical protein